MKELHETCPQCGEVVNLMEEQMTSKSVSSLYGLIYEGPAICQDCYEDIRLEKELQHDFPDTKENV